MSVFGVRVRRGACLPQKAAGLCRAGVFWAAGRVDVLDVFPDSAPVNATLRALAPVLRGQLRVKRRAAKRVTRASV